MVSIAPAADGCSGIGSPYRQARSRADHARFLFRRIVQHPAHALAICGAHVVRTFHTTSHQDTKQQRTDDSRILNKSPDLSQENRRSRFRSLISSRNSLHSTDSEISWLSVHNLNFCILGTNSSVTHNINKRVRPEKISESIAKKSLSISFPLVSSLESPHHRDEPRRKEDYGSS